MFYSIGKIHKYVSNKLHLTFCFSNPVPKKGGRERKREREIETGRERERREKEKENTEYEKNKILTPPCL